MKLKTILLLGLLAFIACDNGDVVWDISPVVIDICVEDINGNDLLNPNTEENIIDVGIKAIYKGEVYEKDVRCEETFTRYYLPAFYGLYTTQFLNGKYALSFGEFNGDATYKKEEIIIDWNDGTQSVITFDWDCKWEKNKPSIYSTYYLNGTKTENPIKIIK